ncbi:hypothetical protein HMI54_014005 [Coelomomyces lativittatus]|nr:hypothetical protein HMI54_014005 [Coelomomyces lativittatus]KAJ1497939.1 hypothetical protein HMI55_005214 [Coelomomyces lativittatus]KAJ1499219.1 hypothetical protein HMI56_004514 [Coelomomyces lativittatus]
MSLNKTDEEWKVILTPLQYRILRKADTEPPFSGQYEKHHEEGTYLCAGCKTPLYESKTKFDSGCGWPAFYDAVPGTVVKRPDNSGGRSRTEM